MSNTSSDRISNHILPTSATMAGVCITIISIVGLAGANHHISVVINRLMALTGLIFLTSCFLSYLSLRPLRQGARLEHYADIAFLLGLSLMVIGGFLLAWEFEHM